MQIDAALDVAGSSLESICLFGGEPLLPETKTSLEYLVSKAPDVSYGMYTNGYYLLDFFDILSKVKIDRIIVTLDGEKHTHDNRRFTADGSPTFDKIMQGIEKYLGNKIPIHIRFNVDKGNFDECNRLKNSLSSLFNKHLEFLSFEVAPMLSSTTDEKTDLTAKIYHSDIEYSTEERMRRSRLLEGSSILGVFAGATDQLKPTYCFCDAHMKAIAFDPYGQMYSCLVSVGMERFSVGTYYPTINFKEDSLYNRNIETIPECRECIYALVCGGGCAMPLANSESLLRPVCSRTHDKIHEILPRLYRLEQAKPKSL